MTISRRTVAIPLAATVVSLVALVAGGLAGSAVADRADDHAGGPTIYGGAVITNAAVGVPQVKALVYIAAFAPDQGESLVQLVTMTPGSEIGPPTLITRQYPLPGGGEGTDLYITQRGFETAFAGDVPMRVADRMWAEQRPFAQEAFVAPSGEPAWKTIPSWYLVATQDRAIPPATQRFMAGSAHATVSEVKASHVPMVSKPAATLEVILAAAEHVQ